MYVAINVVNRKKLKLIAPLSHSTIWPVKKFLLLHIVYGKFASEVGFPPRCLVTARREKCNNHTFLKFFLASLWQFEENASASQ